MNDVKLVCTQMHAEGVKFFSAAQLLSYFLILKIFFHYAVGMKKCYNARNRT